MVSGTRDDHVGVGRYQHATAADLLRDLDRAGQDLHGDLHR